MNPSPNFAKVVKRAALACVTLLFAAAIARADLPRTPIKGIPRVLGREIERFVLLSPIVVDRSEPGVPFTATLTVRMNPGTFIPVTEDAEGIFFQAVNEFRYLRGDRPVGGGIYVSKIHEGRIWVFIGNAQMDSKFGILKDRLPLPASALRSLKVGKTDRRR